MKTKTSVFAVSSAGLGDLLLNWRVIVATSTDHVKRDARSVVLVSHIHVVGGLRRVVVLLSVVGTNLGRRAVVLLATAVGGGACTHACHCVDTVFARHSALIVGLHAERPGSLLNARGTSVTATGVHRSRPALACVIIALAVVLLEVELLFVLLLLDLNVALLQLEHVRVLSFDVLVGLTALDVCIVLAVVLDALAAVLQLLRVHLVGKRI